MTYAPFNLAGKVCVITGGNKGIGLGMAEALAASNADIVIWDPEQHVTLSIDALHDNMDYTPYEGMEIQGWPVTTLSRGQLVWHGGEVVGKPGAGRLLRRGNPQTAELLSRLDD